MNQRQATVMTILAVLAERGVEYELNGSTPIIDVLTAEDKSQTRDTLFDMFRSGDVTVSDSFSESKLHDDSELKKYISGLTNNWIRKAKEFNCGEQYVPKNPGSRQFAGDAQLKALKALAQQQAGNEEAQKEIADAMIARKSQIEAEKAKDIEVDAASLPESLRHLVK